LDQSTQSLNTLALDIQSEYNIRISKQALDKKFTPQAEDFLKNAISNLLEFQLDLKVSSKNKTGSISELRIKDSTKFNLPPHLQNEFPGSGGCGSPSTVSIQYEIDLLKGRIISLNITPANHADQKESREDLKELNKGSLYIRDLGYVNIDYMEAISQQGAYYINRLSPKTEVYEYKQGKYIQLDLHKWHSILQGSCKLIDKNVYIGERKFPCRLIMEAVPEVVREERARKLNMYNKKKGHHMTKSHYTRMGLNLWLTNFTRRTIARKRLKMHIGFDGK
jgi:hypothetical protein